MTVAEIAIVEDIAASPRAVWGLIGDFAGVRRWHPQLVGLEVEGAGTALVRKAHFADWWIAERLDRLDPVAMSLVYTVVASSRPAAVGSRAGIDLFTLGPDETRLRWHAHPPGDIGPEQRAQMEGYYSLRVDHLRQALRRGGTSPRPLL